MTDELTLTIGGKRLQGWDRLRVTRGIEILPSNFDLSLMDYCPGSDEKQLVNPGDPCTVSLGDDLVVTGYIDRWMPSINKTRHEIRATGRSKCQDLVDCSADWPNNVISNATPLQIAQRLATPYGISVTSDVTDMTNVPQFIINWGECAQEIIDRMSRWAAVLYYDLPNGNLFMTRVGTKKAASGVEQGANVEVASYTSAADQRFSDYIGVSLSTTPMRELSPNTAYDSITLARAQDPDAAKMRLRKRIIIVESTMIAAKESQACITWEMNRRYGRSKSLQVTVDSWRDSAGVLWTPNTLVPIKIPAFGLDVTWLLSQVTYSKDEKGTTAQLILMPPEAFSVQPYQFYAGMRELSYGK